MNDDQTRTEPERRPKHSTIKVERFISSWPTGPVGHFSSTHGTKNPEV